MFELYGLILAGGKSLRMGMDKSLLSYNGMPQIQYCNELLQKFCTNIYLSNRKEQGDLQAHKSISQIHDQYIDIGPLGGILTAMKRFPQTAWLVLACDLPFVNSDTLSFLIENRDNTKIATMYKCSIKEGPEPLCGIYEPSALFHIENCIKQKITCARKSFLSAEIKLIVPKDNRDLRNINYREEYDKLKK